MTDIMKEKYFIGEYEQEGFYKEISVDRYNELERCHHAVHGILDIEHKYALLLDNFKELELELLRYSLEHTIHSRTKWTHFAEEHLIFDRRILNVLAASLAYTAQTRKTISKVYGHRSKEYEAFDKTIKDMCTSDVEYIFGSQLRHYAQHQHMPVDMEGVSFSLVRRAPLQSACTIKLKLKKEFLLSDEKVRNGKGAAEFKKILTPMPDEIDLAPRIRGFLRSLSTLHFAMREATADGIKTAVDLWKGMRNECKDLGCGYLPSALATSSDDPRNILRYLPFTAGPLEHLRELQEYNSSGRKIGDDFVTSQDEDKMLRDLTPPRG